MSEAFVRDTLCRIIRDHGRSLVNDPRRCEGLLRDPCPADKREVNLLAGALKKICRFCGTSVSG